MWVSVSRDASGSLRGNSTCMLGAPELLASGFAVDLGDDFSYEVATSPAPVEGPPGGGLRFVVVARVAGTELVRFKVDVSAADVVVGDFESYGVSSRPLGTGRSPPSRSTDAATMRDSARLLVDVGAVAGGRNGETSSVGRGPFVQLRARGLQVHGALLGRELARDPIPCKLHELRRIETVDPNGVERPAGIEEADGHPTVVRREPVDVDDAIVRQAEDRPSRSDVPDAEVAVEAAGPRQPATVADAWPADRPFVVLVPQHEMPARFDRYASCDGVPLFASCVMRLQHEAGHPADESLCMTPTELHAFLSHAIAAYDVDPDRVYLTGLSCGAFAAYEYAATYGAEQIAAMVPIAGEARPALEAAGCTLGAVAIWAFHGDRDDAVDVQGTIEPVNDLMDCPALPEPGVEATVYSGVDHDSWTRTYDLTAGHDIYAWFLGIERAKPEQGD